MTNYFARISPYEMALAGRIFSVNAAADLGGNAVVNLQIKTGTKSPTILSYDFATSAEPLYLEVIESPTVTVGTAAITPRNLNRQSSATATTLFYSDPSAISGGTVIFTDIITAGKGAGGAMNETVAWTLKKSTSYIVRLTQLTNQTTKYTATIQFAEDFQTV